MYKVGFGVFTWPRSERVTNRYGAFNLADKAFEGVGDCTARLNLSMLNALKGKRVRVTVEVVESRKSGHIGDLFLGIFPSRPEVGERVVLGVGKLDVFTLDGEVNLALEPEDGREELWIDPHLLYRVHDQTVNLYVEETDDPCREAPVIKQKEADGTIGADDQGGIQCKRVDEREVGIALKIERLGDGLFALSPQEIKPGKRVRTVKK